MFRSKFSVEKKCVVLSAGLRRDSVEMAVTAITVRTVVPKLSVELDSRAVPHATLGGDRTGRGPWLRDARGMTLWELSRVRGMSDNDSQMAGTSPESLKSSRGESGECPKGWTC